VLEGIADLDERIEEAAAKHPDFFIFESLPGAGQALAPRLLAAFGSQWERYRNASEVQTYSGIAPVMEKSGKKQWIHFRWACPKFLRQSLHEWACHSIGYSAWARAYYQQQRSKGVDHHGAVRALAFKWIRILFCCWKERVAYDESKYLAALTRRGSPLVPVVAIANARWIPLWIFCAQIAEVVSSARRIYLTDMLRRLSDTRLLEFIARAEAFTVREVCEILNSRSQDGCSG
jgi:hypothetical protein